ncbi:Fe(3+) dicitrate ABC transporter permease subunit FecD [Klebsiella huaxiensis]|uniref:Fe(3+) dicitrate transport system permease protein FecD n=1 Tax=Klebsiella huaxiensis TaxID=2153354 RepID=A0A564M9A4_9ENTR|nr:Fe(3+) dicitrate ABC transporter permease subunit FecD [Klebsiella huaxiensis]VUS90061.1 Fe(3+) dicitrate transport system permease protein FecD [Klebsiella huaxiensis]
MRLRRVSFLLLVLALLTVLSLRMGAVPLPWRALLDGWHPGSEHHYVLMQYRLPRVVLALIIGAALAVSGVLIQSVVRNPLASPDILGINHAASLTSVTALWFLPSLSLLWLPLLAFIGGMTAMAVLIILAGFSRPMRLALTGVALSACWASVTDYLLLSRPQEINNALLWLTGSLWARDGSFVIIALPLLTVLLPLSFALSRDLDLLALGHDRAGTLGINIRWLNGYALTLAVALASVSVAVCGPIAFISLVVPHLVRRLFGGRHHYLLPVSALMGGLVLLLADLLARTLSPPMELPAGVLTAIIGAPWFIWLLVRMR